MIKYRPEIDGLRALAVLPVILFHAGFKTFSGGFVGVDVFFVISGYLITSIILAEKQSGTFSLINFYERRSRRILPALFLVMAACFPFAWLWLTPEDLVEFSKSISYVPVFLSNFLFYKQSGYFDAAAELKPLLHTWSLAVEEQYYLFFPVLLITTWQFGKKFIIGLMIFIFITSLCYAQYLVGIKPGAAFYLLPSRFWEILVGAFVAFYYANHNIKRHGHTAEQFGSAFGFILIIYAIFAFDSQTPFPSFYTLVPTVGAALIIVFANHRTLVGKLLGTKLMLGVGLVSYSAYLWHQPLFAFTRHRSLTEPESGLMVVLAVLSFMLAYLTWRYVERPFRNRHRFSRRQVFTSAGIISVLFIVTGLVGQQTKGFIHLYNEQQLKIVGNIDEAKDYTWKRLNDLEHKDFKPNTYKVMVVGDSYAGDFINAVFENNPSNQVSFSTHVIGAVCGNLYLEEDLFKYIDVNAHKVCSDQNWYGDKKVVQLIEQADQVWLVSSWKNWQLPYINKSIANLEKRFGKKFLIVGNKSFGKKIKKIQLSEFSGKSTQELIGMRAPLSEEHISINDFMKNNISPDVFFNLSEAICMSAEECRLFDDRGNFIAYDGGHTTVDGAKYTGNILLKNPRFSGIF